MVLGPLIAAGASLAGGLINSASARDANAQNAAIAAKNMDMQREFANKGIRWKVADAKQAGIHPLYALGAQTNSFAPVSFSATADTSMGNAIANMGQDVGRAINATRTAPERQTAFTQTVQALSVQKMGLENDLLASQIAKLKASTNPPMPTVGPLPPVPEASKQEDRPLLQVGGQRWQTDPSTTNMQSFEDRYGDDGPASWLVPLEIAWRDYAHNAGFNPSDPVGSMTTPMVNATRSWMRKYLPSVGAYTRSRY